ncbi:MAG: AraC family transcriptional regulator [Candidatus Cyclobacteriaceae bacterium M3_2C_046]
MNKNNSDQLKEYTSRINRVIDHIEMNLEQNFRLDELAEVAHFSKFHFHRIFLAMVGETPFQFLNRIRCEKAASKLNTNSKLSISDIGYSCGFSDLTIFSRNFKHFFSCSPTAFRKKGNHDSNQSQMKRNFNQVKYEVDTYFCSHSNTLKWRTNMELNKSVEVKDLPEMTLAYVRHTGPYQGDEGLFERLFQKLFTWAGPRKLLEQPDLKSIVVYHDDPNVTEEDKLRMSVSITVPPDTKVAGEVGKMRIAADEYVIARFVLNAQEYHEAWSWLYGSWFPQSGYQPDDGACFEMYTEEPKDGRMTVDICVPVKPL